MNDVGTDRKILAVMMTDVVGFSGQVVQREESVEYRLASDLKSFREIIKSYSGEVVADRGDGLKVIFSSPVYALKAAIKMQEHVLERNAKQQPDEIRLRHRIGIHLGDVIQVDGSVGGLAVSVAARLEQICPPGKICFSDTVHQLTRQEVQLTRTPQGVVELKNLPQGVKVWVGRLGGDYDYSTPTTKKSSSAYETLLAAERRDREYRRGALTTAVIMLLILTIIGGGSYGYFTYQSILRQAEERQEKLIAAVPPEKKNEKELVQEGPKMSGTSAQQFVREAPVVREKPKKEHNPIPDEKFEDVPVDEPVVSDPPPRETQPESDESPKSGRSPANGESESQQEPNE
jgi:class 3 adenylate cyclase